MARYIGSPYVDDELPVPGGPGAKTNDSLYGDSGNDTLYGGKGNDTLTGGEDTDVFVFANNDGNDVITDYMEEDKIQFTSGTPKFKKSGSNVIVTLGTGKITVQGAANKIITYIDKDGNEQTYPNPVTINGKTITLKEEYAKTDFALGDYDDNLQTVDASAVTHDLTITGNAKANRITATEEDDYINGGAGKDTIFAGDGNDTLVGGKGNDNLFGGDGKNVFVYNNGDGNDIISDYKQGDIIRVSGNVSRTAVLNGNDYVFTVGEGSITVKNSKNKYIQVVDSSGTMWWPESPDDGWTYTAAKVTLNKKYRDDTFDVAVFDDFAGVAKTIDASAVTHDMTIIANKQANRIIGTEEDDYINGGAGKDTILAGDGNDTIEGGKGNDSLSGGDGKNVFIYNNGDGDDVITDFKQGDVIKIASGTVPTTATLNGKDYIFSIGKGSITVKNGKDKYIKLVDANDNATWYPETPDGEDGYTYSKGKVTINKKYIKDTFDVAELESGFSGAVQTIDASAVPHELTIIGNSKANRIIGTEEDDYINGLAGKDTINGGDGNDTIEGGTGNDNLTGGDGADVFVYNRGDGNDVITDFTNDDEIIINNDTVTKYTKSGSNMILTLASKATMTVTGGANKAIRYSDLEGDSVIGNLITYNKKGTAATLTSAYDKDSFLPSDYSEYANLASIDAAAVNHEMTITGNGKANYIVGTEEDDVISGGNGKDSILAGDGNDTVNGGEGNDSLIGGKGNDNLTGGAGSDVFVYNRGDGNDTITDYANDDKINISDTVSKITTSKNGQNIIFTLSNKSKITVQNGSDKVITYIENGVEKTYGDDTRVVKYNEDFTVATITANYEKTSFDTTDYSSYVATLATINASAVQHDIAITGSGLANSILGSAEADYIDGGKGKDTLLGNDGDDTLLGGDGNDKVYGGEGQDSLWGGKGSDTLWGGDGDDIFVYQNGDGKDTIADFDEGDIIRVLSGTVGAIRSTSGGDVSFEIGSGELIVKDASNKYVELVDGSGNPLKHYSPRS